MCMVSNIGDVFGEKWKQYTYPYPQPGNPTIPPIADIGRYEFDELKKEVIALKELLLAAKKFDKATGQPDCEMADKVKILRAVAEAVGVNLDEVFKQI